MKSFFKILSAALLLCAFAVSCGGDSTEPDPEPTPNPPAPVEDDKIVIPEGTNLSPTLSQDGGSQTVRFTAKQPWQARVDDTRAAADWLHVAPASGGAGEAELSITADPNDATDDREGYVKIVSGSTIVTITVTQKARSATSNFVNFPDANFKAYMIGYFDKNEDGEISEHEASLITRIECSNKKIQSLEGIEHCTALTYLNCGGNQLTTLDVSKNTALTELYCDLNQLTTLDASKNTALKVLICYENQLTTLDINGCSALTVLNCRHNQLTALDVSKNTALTKLFCEYNQLTTLDVSKNIALTDLSCEYNQLTTLDVSKNTALTYLSCFANPFEMLNLGDAVANIDDYLLGSSTKLKVIGSKITCLVVSANKLQSLDVSECPALTVLACNNNQLTALDVSKNTALKDLGCGENQLTALDVSKNIALTELSCSHNQLTTLDVSKNTILTELYCRSNQLTTLDVSKNTALTRLDCRSNQLTSLDVSGCSALTEECLDCSNNLLEILNLGEANLLSIDLHDELGSSTKLKVIGSKITFLGVSATKLQSLDVSECPALTDLNCSENQLTMLDVSGCSALQYLSCRTNQLTTLDVSKNTILTELDCRSNQLTTLDASGCSALTRLDCFYNPLEVLIFGDAVPSSLDLYDGGLGSSTKLKVIGSKITSLYVKGNHLQSLDVSECPALTDLNCSGNQLTMLDVSGCSALTGLDCDGNQLTTLDVSGCSALQYLSCRTNQLTTLDVSKTNLGNSTERFPLYCGYMQTLQTLYLKTGWKINGINVYRNSFCIPDQTEILYKD